jgi:hypothetical protein
MRGALVCVLLGMLLTTARADPFAVRNPVPDAPPSASTTDDPFDTNPKVEILDPGYAYRRNATLLAVGGGVLWGGAFVVAQVTRRRYDEALARIDDNSSYDEQVDAINDANHAQRIARWVSTPLFVTGALAIGASILVYSEAPPRIRREHIVVMPAVDRDGAGVAISGGF